MPRSATAATEFKALLDAYPAGVQRTAHAARKWVLELLPGATEVVDRKDRVIGYGYGTAYRDMICTLILSKSGVKLGVVNGVDLPDPRHLMEGGGKRHRHVALDAPEDLRRTGLRPLLRAARSAWRRANTSRRLSSNTTAM